MKTISTFWLSVIVGTLIEGAICVLTAKFATFGPCGPGDNVSGTILLLHLPALEILHGLLPDDSVLQLPAIILLTTVMWTFAVFVVITGIKAIATHKK